MSSNCDSCFSLKLVGPTEQRLHFCRYEVLAGAAWCSWGLGPGVYWGPLRGQAGTGGGWGPGQSLQLQRHTCAGPPHTQQPRPTVSKHKATRIISNYYYNWQSLKYRAWHPLIVARYRQIWWIKTDEWHLGRQRRVWASILAGFHFGPLPLVVVLKANKKGFLQPFLL